MEKRVLEPKRLRRVPRQFGWADHRLLLDRHLERCTAAAWGLYLFLVVAGDGQGLSYYSDAAVCRILSLTPDVLTKLRKELLTAKLLAYQKPLYQILSIEKPWCRYDARPKMKEPISVAAILQQLIDGEQR